MSKLFYKKIETCEDCFNKITKDLRFSDKKMPYSRNVDFCKITDEELFLDEIPISCPLNDYQEKIEANETGRVWLLKSKKRVKETCWCGNPIDYTNVDCATFGLCKDHASDS